MRVARVTVGDAVLLAIAIGYTAFLVYKALDPPRRKEEQLIKESIARSEWARRWAEKYVSKELPEEIREQVVRELAERLAERFYEAMFE